ncbi:hypothetical protein [Sorangium sp. So ce1389]|uniref:hypothetical protein n=1 Tax=Sorangium sp. So ce1389 TaxID=3133336 RepID=UPI003F62A4DF
MDGDGPELARRFYLEEMTRSRSRSSTPEASTPAATRQRPPRRRGRSAFDNAAVDSSQTALASAARVFVNQLVDEHLEEVAFRDRRKHRTRDPPPCTFQPLRWVATVN